MADGPAAKGAVEKEKKSKKEKKDQEKIEIQKIVDQIRAVIRAEKNADPSSPEWEEFEGALRGFMNGDVKGNASIISIRIYDNIQSYSKGKRNYIEYAKWQEISKKLLQEMKKVPGAEQDPNAQHLFTFLGHVANGELKNITEKDKKEKDKKAASDEWVVVEKKGKGAPINLDEKTAKEDLDEAQRLLKEFHEKMGLADPEALKKMQKKKDKKFYEKDELSDFQKKIKKASKEAVKKNDQKNEIKDGQAPEQGHVPGMH